jgi:hypothetical protein
MASKKEDGIGCPYGRVWLRVYFVKDKKKRGGCPLSVAPGRRMSSTRVGKKSTGAGSTLVDCIHLPSVRGYPDMRKKLAKTLPVVKGKTLTTLPGVKGKKVVSLPGVKGKKLIHKTHQGVPRVSMDGRMQL